jgi:XRE family transcriptional regulator, regulator of sulfur utilization
MRLAITGELWFSAAPIVLVHLIKFFFTKTMNEGNSIRLIRKKFGLTQQEMADKCGLSQTSLSQIENGLKRPSTGTIKKICKALDVPEALIYILGMEQDDVSENRKDVYKLLYPSIIEMALMIIAEEGRDILPPNLHKS